MNICEDIKAYDIKCIHFKSSPSDFGLSWIAITDADITEEAWVDLNEGLHELLDDESFTGGEYDFMSGSISVIDDKLVLIGNQSREVHLTKLFNTPVFA